ncbi:DUF2637 domain-containing protein [Nocardiaceae bacterium YC2-7]|uniref:DUF2637 domain-containing protein n=1 Tax=Antrihabitans stalactiti TaxID=2584121 RepID=A0A848KE19_9NOCA|nr:DUF2637 domain-containing protein [Antrihabitans stalactiti]
MRNQSRLDTRGAVSITAIIVLSSFVLSFATLRDLAVMAGISNELSWLWPVVVDGTILQATISVIALTRTDSRSGGRVYFWFVLFVSAVVSVSANALHAVEVGGLRIHPAIAAVIATVAPVALLASTHGIVELLRNRQPQAVDDGPSGVTPSEKSVDLSWHEIARTLVDSELTTRLGFDDVVEIVRCSFELDMSNRTIAKRIGSNHATVGRVLEAARLVAERQE